MSAYRFSVSLLVLAVLTAASALAQAPAAPPLRLRGEITKVEGDMITMQLRNGDMASVKLTDKTGVTGVKKSSMADVTQGKYVGIASMPQADGSFRALEVLIFPEAARGSNEGHYPWDLAPTSMMTNANISAEVTGNNGKELTLTPKGRDAVKITVPPETPVVTFAPADRSKIAAGAKVLVIAVKGADGSLTSPRILVGLDVTPPM